MNGKQLAEANFTLFVAWEKGKSDADFRDMAHRGKLSRTEVAAQCGFVTSVLRQNPRVKKAFKDLEDRLRKRGVLPELAEVAADESTDDDESAPAVIPPAATPGKSAIERARLSRLEVENAGLRAEITELKRQLGKFAVLQEVLAETGRLPR